MAKNPTPSLLDPGQIIKRAFDDDNDALRVDATVLATLGTVEVVVDAASGDSIKIGDGLGHFASVNVDGSLNVTGTSTVSGTVSTNLNGLATFQTSQYTIGTSAVQLTVTPLTNRSSMSIKVVTTGNNAIYIGNSSGVTTSTGFPLFNGDAIQLDLKSTQVIYAISSAAAQTAFVIELGG